MRTPSIKTLAAVFEAPKAAKRILQMSRAELALLPAGAARIAECYHPPMTGDLRLHCLNAIAPGLYGIESCETADGEYADYLNAGDTYTSTLIYWRGRYRVQDLGSFVEAQERRGIHFR